MTKPITVATRPETRIFRVTKDAPNEAPVLSYSCYHLGRDKTASLPTEWMIEIMYDSGGSMSNNTNVVPAIVDDLYVENPPFLASPLIVPQIHLQFKTHEVASAAQESSRGYTGHSFGTC